jgi:hypothetical protein
MLSQCVPGVRDIMSVDEYDPHSRSTWKVTLTKKTLELNGIKENSQ